MKFLLHLPALFSGWANVDCGKYPLAACTNAWGGSYAYVYIYSFSAWLTLWPTMKLFIQVSSGCSWLSMANWISTLNAPATLWRVVSTLGCDSKSFSVVLFMILNTQYIGKITVIYLFNSLTLTILNNLYSSKCIFVCLLVYLKHTNFSHEAPNTIETDQFRLANSNNSKPMKLQLKIIFGWPPLLLAIALIYALVYII